MVNPVNILVRIEADKFCHQGHKVLGRGIAGRPADCSALQAGNAANVVMRDELVATDMRCGHGCQGCTSISGEDDFWCEVQSQSN